MLLHAMDVPAWSSMPQKRETGGSGGGLEEEEDHDNSIRKRLRVVLQTPAGEHPSPAKSTTSTSTSTTTSIQDVFVAVFDSWEHVKQASIRKRPSAFQVGGNVKAGQVSVSKGDWLVRVQGVEELNSIPSFGQLRETLESATYPLSLEFARHSSKPAEQQPPAPVSTAATPTGKTTPTAIRASRSSSSSSKRERLATEAVDVDAASNNNNNNEEDNGDDHDKGAALKRVEIASLEDLEKKMHLQKSGSCFVVVSSTYPGVEAGDALVRFGDMGMFLFATLRQFTRVLRSTPFPIALEFRGIQSVDDAAAPSPGASSKRASRRKPVALSSLPQIPVFTVTTPLIQHDGREVDLTFSDDDAHDDPDEDGVSSSSSLDGFSSATPPAAIAATATISSTTAPPTAHITSWRTGQIVRTPFGYGSALNSGSRDTGSDMVEVALHWDASYDTFLPRAFVNVRDVRACTPEPVFDYDKFQLSREEVARLRPGIYLNDSIVDMFLRYSLDALPEATRSRVFVLSSHFYTKLSTGSYEDVKTWTKKVDVFAKDFIVVPINGQTHWSLVIMCFPNALKPTVLSAEDMQANEEEAVGVRKKGGKKVALAQRLPAGGTPSDSKALSPAATTTTTTTPENGRKKRSAKSKANLALQHHALEELHGALPLALEEPEEEEEAVVTTSSSSSSSSSVTGGPSPFILRMDSTKGHVARDISQPLRLWLQKEWGEKKKPKAHANEVLLVTGNVMPVVTPTLPLQDNHCDCGVFMLLYAEKFLRHVAPEFAPTTPWAASKYFGAKWFEQREALRKRLEMLALVRMQDNARRGILL